MSIIKNKLLSIGLGRVLTTGSNNAFRVKKDKPKSNSFQNALNYKLYLL